MNSEARTKKRKKRRGLHRASTKKKGRHRFEMLHVEHVECIGELSDRRERGFFFFNMHWVCYSSTQCIG